MEDDLQSHRIIIRPRRLRLVRFLFTDSLGEFTKILIPLCLKIVAVRDFLRALTEQIILTIIIAVLIDRLGCSARSESASDGDTFADH